jgi:hypothetical protein
VKLLSNTISSAKNKKSLNNDNSSRITPVLMFPQYDKMSAKNDFEAIVFKMCKPIFNPEMFCRCRGGKCGCC